MLKKHEPSDFYVGMRFFGVVNFQTFQVVNIYREKRMVGGKIKEAKALTISFKNIGTGKLYSTDLETLCRCNIKILEDKK